LGKLRRRIMRQRKKWSLFLSHAIEELGWIGLLYFWYGGNEPFFPGMILSACAMIFSILFEVFFYEA